MKQGFGVFSNSDIASILRGEIEAAIPPKTYEERVAHGEEVNYPEGSTPYRMKPEKLPVRIGFSNNKRSSLGERVFIPLFEGHMEILGLMYESTPGIVELPNLSYAKRMDKPSVIRQRRILERVERKNHNQAHIFPEDIQNNRQLFYEGFFFFETREDFLMWCINSCVDQETFIRNREKTIDIINRRVKEIEGTEHSDEWHSEDSQYVRRWLNFEVLYGMPKYLLMVQSDLLRHPQRYRVNDGISFLPISKVVKEHQPSLKLIINDRSWFDVEAICKTVFELAKIEVSVLEKEENISFENTRENTSNSYSTSMGGDSDEPDEKMEHDLNSLKYRVFTKVMEDTGFQYYSYPMVILPSKTVLL